MSAPFPDRSVGALAGATLILAAVAAWPWLPAAWVPSSFLPFAGRSTAAGAAPRSAPETAGLDALAPLPPLASFAATVERPLFSPSRRPPAAVKAVAAGAALAKRYRLLGLIDDGGQRRALVASGKHSFEVGEGAALDGWTVQRIAPDSLVLSSPAGSAVLRLHEGEPAAPDEQQAIESRAVAAAAVPLARNRTR